MYITRTALLALEQFSGEILTYICNNFLILFEIHTKTYPKFDLCKMASRPITKMTLTVLTFMIKTIIFLISMPL